jgi:ABC-2 type transport system ATP-binding protein
LRTIATLLQITSGSITVFGYELPREAGEVRKIISYLPEEAGAYKNLTGKEYLNFIAKFFSTCKHRQGRYQCPFLADCQDADSHVRN